MVIRCNTQDRDLASTVAEIERRVGSQVELPEGYFIEYSGQFESQQRATRTIVVLAGVSVTEREIRCPTITRLRYSASTI